VTGGRCELSVQWKEKKTLLRLLTPRVPVSDVLWEECSFLRVKKKQQ
jgi:hypothetical protein